MSSEQATFISFMEEWILYGGTSFILKKINELAERFTEGGMMVHD
jgi:hypothetical protein